MAMAMASQASGKPLVLLKHPWCGCFLGVDASPGQFTALKIKSRIRFNATHAFLLEDF